MLRDMVRRHDMFHGPPSVGWLGDAVIALLALSCVVYCSTPYPAL